MVEVTVYAPVLTTDRTVDRSHTRQADVHLLGGVICFDRFVDVLEHCRGRFVGGISIAFFKVNIHAVAPRIFLHNTDKFRAEGVLCAVRIITDSLKNAVRTVIGNGKQPTDVWPLFDIGQHIANSNTAFSNRSRGVHFERKQTDGVDAVTVITECLIHSGVAHKCPHHDTFAF